MWMVVLVLVLTTVVLAFLDVWYFIRAFLSVLSARLQPVVKDLLKEHSFSGVVLPHDLDFLLHMNNSRYLREADFARLSYFTRSGLFGAIHSIGSGMVMAASTIRYRRSLRLLETFEIRTRLLCWDEKAFYVEQRFVTPKDGFVCAILLSRQHITGNSPDKVVQTMCKRKVESPEFPDEVMHWIDYNDNSSQKLRAESGAPDNSKDQ
ncbi:protein THEM6 [Hyla sarda]|uniref:protein THEM6 n=1 Tax=Hyla sarda TaxID=327740 RepID=UPI0024C31027|nr:protein THEM6 [Hyla sarda]XP_056378857.1 protein THEM6 [Hyla sarda]XP_056378858.1 protein THEM6 [Hyla sarda]XP_056378859.1 protein THEM6 [Hyla sarda]XP_056378860.1 protein THEM6 [Hyla sarda]